MHFQIKFAAITITVSLLYACSDSVAPSKSSDDVTTTAPITGYIQEKEQLYLDYDTASHENTKYIPLNYDKQVGMWFPYMDYGEYMQGKSAEEYRSAVRKNFDEAKANSVNTVYVHIRPCGDAYYNSEIFPSGTYLDGDYDPLQIMIEEAHAIQLSIHAWINPLRCQTIEQMAALPDSYITKKWADEHTGKFINIVGDRYYLNPAYSEVIDLICRGVDEIVRNYNVDGLHIDDYFYPTTSEDFDKNAFAVSGHTDLAAWRLENCNRLVHSIYESVKRADNDLIFGISPQGNIDANYSSQYADVRLWGSSIGYCDYIAPQIYYGFENETCPFAETLAEWESIMTNESVSLVIGLAAYKLGAEDKWAGAAGEHEWIDNPDIIKQQIELIGQSSADGYALYY